MDVKGERVVSENVERRMELITRVAPCRSREGKVERARPARCQRLAAADVVGKDELGITAARQGKRARRAVAVVRDREGLRPVAGNEAVGEVVIPYPVRWTRAQTCAGTEVEIRWTGEREARSGRGLPSGRGKRARTALARVGRGELDGNGARFPRAKAGAGAGVSRLREGRRARECDRQHARRGATGVGERERL